MWQSTHYGTNNLLWEILLRVLLLGLVCISQIKSRPYIRHISETELLNEYKRPRLDSYVPAWATVLLIVFVPLACICTRYMTTRDYVDTAQSLLAWTLALTINAVITESIKLIIGRPRPDFFWRCFPDGQVVPGLQCTGNPYDIIEGRKSFPSGHSSFSFCSLSFLSLWLCGKLGVLSRRRGRSCGLVICLVPMMIAGMVAMSRYCDNHHHWEDVFVGSLLGIACSYFCYQQYYHPLESEWSGEPYVTMDNEMFSTTYDGNDSTHHVQCCTKDIDNICLMLQLRNKKKLETNKTISWEICCSFFLTTNYLFTKCSTNWKSQCSYNGYPVKEWCVPVAQLLTIPDVVTIGECAGGSINCSTYTVLNVSAVGNS